MKKNNGLWDTYTGPFVVSTDGHHLLHFYSTDNAGNTEQEKTRAFTIQHPPDLNVSIIGGFGIRVTITNLGSLDLRNESWNLTLTGGIIFFGKHKSGIATINAGDAIVLKTLVFGVGKTTITFSIASSETTVQGSVFLFFVRI